MGDIDDQGPDSVLDSALATKNTDIETETETGAKAADRPAAKGMGLRHRVFGFTALLAGLAGMILALVFAFLTLRVGFGATGIVDDLLAPIETAIDRIETRIDQADDVVDREGASKEELAEIQARTEGVGDLVSTATDLLDAVESHPIYGSLPADLADLGQGLESFELTTSRIADALQDTTSSDELPAGPASIVADEIDTMQGSILKVREATDTAASSLRRWVRLGMVFGFAVAGWGFWGQYWLFRRGLRGVRGQPL